MRIEGVLDVWGGGQILAFSAIDGRTDYHGGLVARTSQAGTSIEVKLPGECLVRFDGDRPRRCVLGGDFFEFDTASGRARGAFLDARHLLIEGLCEVRPAPGAKVAWKAEGGRTLVGAEDGFDAGLIAFDLDAAVRARRTWLESLPMPEGLSDRTRRTLAKAFSQMKTMVCSAEGGIGRRWTTPDRWPHRKMWLWDSAFHAIGFRHLDPAIARDAISAVIDCQREDGFIPIAASPDAIESVTQPPVLALGAKLVHEASPDEAWIEEMYPRLVRYLEWDLANRDSDGAGLAEWVVTSNPNCRCDECGMDNSPRFDEPGRLDAPDFNAFLAAEYEALAGFARMLGREDEARAHNARSRAICGLMNERLWDDALGIYCDYDVMRGVRSTVLASAGFLPLIAGAPSREQAERLARHLEDPATFGTPLPVPSIAASDEAHYRKDMWRGPVWVNVNWLIARGLDRYGLRDAAELIRRKTMDAIERDYARFGTLFEFYDDKQEVDPPRLERKGACDPARPYNQVFHDYGWTATLYVDMAMSSSKP